MKGTFTLLPNYLQVEIFLHTIDLWATSTQSKLRFTGHKSSQFLNICRVKILFTETSSQRTSWSVAMGISSSLISGLPRSLPRGHTLSAAHRSTLHRRYYWTRAMESQSIGGHLECWSMKCWLDILHSKTMIPWIFIERSLIPSPGIQMDSTKTSSPWSNIFCAEICLKDLVISRRVLKISNRTDFSKTSISTTC